jgi:hypothetical protein
VLVCAPNFKESWVSSSLQQSGFESSKERSCLSKRRYWSQVDAMVMAARCIERRNLPALGAYRCRNCAGWHLTRQV